jgi:hypothetical protein
VNAWFESGDFGVERNIKAVERKENEQRPKVVEYEMLGRVSEIRNVACERISYLSSVSGGPCRSM